MHISTQLTTPTAKQPNIEPLYAIYRHAQCKLLKKHMAKRIKQTISNMTKH